LITRNLWCRGWVPLGWVLPPPYTSWTAATAWIRPMKTVTLLAAILLEFATAASAQTMFRDASGRITGTVSTDSNGTKTFRDGSGRTTGTATRDSNGTTTFRDAGGRTSGTITAPRR
jgi:YD repeat-containing protein